MGKSNSKDSKNKQVKLSFKERLFKVKPAIKAKMLTSQTRQLAVMLDAGLPLLVSLRTLAEQCSGFRLKATRAALNQVVSEVEAGTSLSESLARQPKSFSKLYLSMVRAGEASGAMVQVLERLADYMERSQKFKKKVVSSLVYPSVVMTVAIGVTLVLMVFVVPRFVEIFSDLLEGAELPGLTQFVVAISNVASKYIVHCIIGGIALGFIFSRLLKTRGGKYVADFLLIKIPPFSSFVIKISVARFCSTLSTLLEAGVPALDSIRIVYDTTANELVKRVIQVVYDSINEGEGISTPLEQTKLFPLIVVRFVEIGEKTGSLPDMLSRIAVQYEEEVDNALDTLVSLIEPVMIVFLAVVVGTIVIALFMPLISIIEALGM